MNRHSMLVAGACALSLAAVSAGGRPDPAPQRASQSAPSTFAARPVIDQYCVSCHSQRLKTGGLVLEGIDLAAVPQRAETWEKVLRKLRAGMMPPAGMPRPDGATSTRMIGWLEGELDATAAAHPRPGR